VGFVSKSGGMSNEAYNIISQNTDGLYEGIAIGGDSYPGSTLLDHLLRFEANPDIAMLVSLGEVGGTEEYRIADAVKEGRITKPIVCWVTGTIATKMTGEVQFGHAGAKAGAANETAEAKNLALKEAGVIVPDSFDDYGDKIRETYDALVAAGKITPAPEPAIPPIPQDLKVIEKTVAVRKPTGIVCSITDDRGDEPLYCGVPMSKVIESGMPLGEMIGLLWFNLRRAVLQRAALRALQWHVPPSSSSGGQHVDGAIDPGRPAPPLPLPHGRLRRGDLLRVRARRDHRVRDLKRPLHARVAVT